MIRVTSKSQLPKHKRFSIDLFKKPFCFKEKKKYKLYEFPNFKDKNFWKFPKKYKSKKNNTLIVSGPSRNGNHLMLSLLDGHSQFGFHSGEDDTLRTYLAAVKLNEKTAIDKIKNYDPNYVLKLSGQIIKKKSVTGFNKWKALNELIQKNQRLNVWSGSQKEFMGHVQDFQDIHPNIDYLKFEKNILEKKKYNNFFDFWFDYLKASKVLSRDNKFKIKYPFRWCGSGLRRELFFLLGKTNNVFAVCPIREFNTYYFSFAKARFKTHKIKQNVINELWEHWRHKVIDFLILKKKYPNNIFIVKYEDMVGDTKNTMKRLSKQLGVKFEQILTSPTILKKKHLGNSSFKKPKKYLGKVFIKKKVFNTSRLPTEYNDILNLINKVKV